MADRFNMVDVRFRILTSYGRLENLVDLAGYGRRHTMSTRVYELANFDPYARNYKADRTAE
jgi:hypothetical protein